MVTNSLVVACSFLTTNHQALNFRIEHRTCSSERLQFYAQALNVKNVYGCDGNRSMDQNLLQPQLRPTNSLSRPSWQQRKTPTHSMDPVEQVDCSKLLLPQASVSPFHPGGTAMYTVLSWHVSEESVVLKVGYQLAIAKMTTGPVGNQPIYSMVPKSSARNWQQLSAFLRAHLPLPHPVLGTHAPHQVSWQGAWS